MLDAKKMSEAIRVKRKKIKAEGLDKMIDTAPGPQMNPQDILNLKQKAQIDATLDVPEKSEAPSDPADADIKGSSQVKSDLKKSMARVQKILNKLSVG